MLLAVAVWGTALEARPQRPLGPAPRDGKGRFVNSAGELPRAGLAVALPFFLRRTLGIFRSGRGAPEWWLNDGAALRGELVTKRDVL